jgi:serine/threonine protein kinase
MVLKMLEHPNILCLHRFFSDNVSHHLVMHLCEGGDLRSRLKQRHLAESEARLCVEHILCALHYIHSKSVIHRDLKPANFLLARDGPVLGNTVQVADFGFSRYLEPGTRLAAVVGTADYMAPEVSLGNYNQTSDLWSVGVTFFELLSNRLPFYGRDVATVRRKVSRGYFTFDHRCWKKISQNSKNLVASLLEMIPEKRLDAYATLAIQKLSAALGVFERYDGGFMSVRAQEASLADVIATFHPVNNSCAGT